jgi:tetratricopeptide (TPR) repeat protein
LKIAPDLEGALIGSARVATRISELAPKEKWGEGLPEAEKLFRRVLDIRRDNEYALEVLGDVSSRQALVRQDFAVAIRAANEAYEQAWTIDAQLDHSQLRIAEINLHLAVIYRDAQLMAATIELFRIAVRQFPERARAHSGLGDALSQSVISKLATGDPAAILEESIAEFKQAAALDRRNVNTHCLCARRSKRLRNCGPTRNPSTWKK